MRIGSPAACAAARFLATDLSWLVTVCGASRVAMVASGPELYWCTVSMAIRSCSSRASEAAQSEEVPAVSGPAMRLCPTASAQASQSA
jgi:hypothetical protein